MYLLPEPGPSYELLSRQTEVLADVLRRVLKTDQIREQAKLADLAAAWREVLTECVGARAVEATRILGLRRGVLHVAVQDSALLAELRGYHERPLLDHLRAAAPRRAVNRVRWTVEAPAPPPMDNKR